GIEPAHRQDHAGSGRRVRVFPDGARRRLCYKFRQSPREANAPMSTIESVLHETRAFPPTEAFVKQANISGMAAYEAMCKEAERDFEGFWARHAKNELIWTKPFTRTLDE